MLQPQSQHTGTALSLSSVTPDVAKPPHAYNASCSRPRMRVQRHGAARPHQADVYCGSTNYAVSTVAVELPAACAGGGARGAGGRRWYVMCSEQMAADLYGAGVV